MHHLRPTPETEMRRKQMQYHPVDCVATYGHASRLFIFENIPLGEHASHVRRANVQAKAGARLVRC